MGPHVCLSLRRLAAGRGTIRVTTREWNALIGSLNNAAPLRTNAICEATRRKPRRAASGLKCRWDMCGGTHQTSLYVKHIQQTTLWVDYCSFCLHSPARNVCLIIDLIAQTYIVLLVHFAIF